MYQDSLDERIEKCMTLFAHVTYTEKAQALLKLDQIKYQRINCNSVGAMLEVLDFSPQEVI